MRRTKERIEENSQNTKAPCNRCARETKHVVVAVRKTSQDADVEGAGTIWWEDTYEMLECCGCESVSLKHTHYFSEEGEDRVQYYPPPVARPSPKWLWKLPFDLASLLNEVYAALHSNSRTLALMGARTVVDVVILNKIGDVGTFEEKLANLENRGYIGDKNREFLATALDAGSAAAHRGYRPKPEQLHHVMDIVENLLESVYVLEKAAKDLAKKVPPRRSPK